MNILYRNSDVLEVGLESKYDRFMFYQEHFFDNIYFVDSLGRFRGYTNYSMELGDTIAMNDSCLCYGASVDDVLTWFRLNPGKHRLPVVRDGFLFGEYFDADSDGKCLYQNIEDRAFEIIGFFQEDLRDWASDKVLRITGRRENNIRIFQNIVSQESWVDSYKDGSYDFLIDMDICPEFRKRLQIDNPKTLSVSEILIPILLRKLLGFCGKNNVTFNVFNGIRKSELKGLLPYEKSNAAKSIEEVLQDDRFISIFTGNDRESLSFLSAHRLDLNQLPRTVSNGIHNIVADRCETYLNVSDGIRLTFGNPDSPTRYIHMFGPCAVFGLCVADSQTIASHLQRMVNEISPDIQVINHGTSYGKDILNDLLSMMTTPIGDGDIVIWMSGFMDDEVGLLDSVGIPVFSLKDCVSNLHGWFLENTFHCNSLINQIYAEQMLDSISPLEDVKKQHKRLSMIEAFGIPLVHDTDAIMHSRELDEYVNYLKKNCIQDGSKTKGCIVMNANPCTRGHLYLIDEALKEVDILYVLLVQESTLGFSYLDREAMLNQNLEGKNNVIVLPGGSIFTSAISFPEYFNRMSTEVNPLKNHKIFCEKIAPALGVTKRFFGEESEDNVTRMLNATAMEFLPQYGIEARILPRLKSCGGIISAKNVRKFLRERNFDELAPLVTSSTFNYLVNHMESWNV